MELSAKVVIPVASLALFWTWESLQPFFGQPRGRLRHAARNLGLALMNTVIISLGLAAGLAVVSLWADERALGLLAVLDLPPMLRAATSFLVLDAAMYLWHRANHRIRLLWRSSISSWALASARLAVARSTSAVLAPAACPAWARAARAFFTAIS